MKLHRWMIVPAFAGALAPGACGEEEAIEEGDGLLTEETVEPEVAPVGADAEVVGTGVTEVLGDGIDDDADGLINEES